MGAGCFEAAGPLDFSVKIKASFARRPKAAQVEYAGWDESLALMAGRVYRLFPRDRVVAAGGIGQE